MRSRNRKLHSRLVGLSALLISSFLSANVVRELSLEQKVNQSSLVLIGSVVKVRDQVNPDGSEYALVNVQSVLKGVGRKPVQIRVLYHSNISELDPKCCELGAVYLLFLEKLPGGGYRSVNGAFGVYRIEQDLTNRAK